MTLITIINQQNNSIIYDYKHIWSLRLQIKMVNITPKGLCLCLTNFFVISIARTWDWNKIVYLLQSDEVSDTRISHIHDTAYTWTFLDNFCILSENFYNPVVEADTKDHCIRYSSPLHFENRKDIHTCFHFWNLLLQLWPSTEDMWKQHRLFCIICIEHDSDL